MHGRLAAVTSEPIAVPEARRVPEPPSLSGRRVFLRPLNPADYGPIRSAECAPSVGVFYRHRGVTLAPDQFVQSLWTGVLVQFAVCQVTTGELTGTVAVYGTDFRNGHARLAAMVMPAYLQAGWPLEGIQLLLDYVFDVFPFRKLYADVLEPNLSPFRSSVGDLFRLEGRLIGHEYYAGTYLDSFTLAVHRDDWRAHRGAWHGSRLATAIRQRINQHPGNGARCEQRG